MTEQHIYLICRPCDDSYYEGHPTNVAFPIRDQAEKFLEDNNLVVEDDEFNTNYYIQEITLYFI